MNFLIGFVIAGMIPVIIWGVVILGLLLVANLVAPLFPGHESIVWTCWKVAEIICIVIAAVQGFVLGLAGGASTLKG